VRDYSDRFGRSRLCYFGSDNDERSKRALGFDDRYGNIQRIEFSVDRSDKLCFGCEWGGVRGNGLRQTKIGPPT
jgi:hypothetical protein